MRTAVPAGAVPLRAGGRHPARQLLDQGLRLPGRRRLGRPDHVHRDANARRLPASASVSGEVEGVPGRARPWTRSQPGSLGLGRPWTRARRGAGRDALGCDRLAGGALTSRGPWDHDHVPTLPTFTTSRQQRGSRSNSWTHQTCSRVPPQFCRRARSVTTAIRGTNSLEPDGLRADTHGPAGATSTSRGRGHEPLHGPQPDARLGLRARVHRAELERHRTQLRPDRAPGRRTTRSLGDVQAGAGIPTPGLRRTRQREHDRRSPTACPSVTNMYFWQPIAGAFYRAVRRRGLRHGRHRPRVRPHDREPHDRQGPHPARVTTPAPWASPTATCSGWSTSTETASPRSR